MNTFIIKRSPLNFSFSSIGVSSAKQTSWLFKRLEELEQRLPCQITISYRLKKADSEPNILAEAKHTGLVRINVVEIKQNGKIIFYSRGKKKKYAFLPQEILNISIANPD